MVGDGATDLEARTEPGAACLFVGYGGVVVRANVAAAADWYVHRIDELTEALAGGGGEEEAAA
jgi:phosphoglycolate phosphatase-like HAD superfamily hydrolase